jgi:hypothetical protein
LVVLLRLEGAGLPDRDGDVLVVEVGVDGDGDDLRARVDRSGCRARAGAPPASRGFDERLVGLARHL